MYATVEQVDTFATTYYSSTDPIRVAWEALTAEDKQAKLNMAEFIIDQLPYKGKAQSSEHAFPREPSSALSLLRVREASISLVLQRNGSIEEQERLSLQKQGVVSYKIGDLSETFDKSSKEQYDMFAFDVVFPFLRTWLGGGYIICPTRLRK